MLERQSYSKRLFTLASVLIFLTLAIMGCGRGGEEENSPINSEQDVTVTKIVSTNPTNAMTAVPVDSLIIINFSEIMDANTITAATFLVNDDLVNIDGTITYNDTVATFTPSIDLAYSTTYTVTITMGVQNLAGDKLNSDFSWVFTTELGQVELLIKDVAMKPQALNDAKISVENYIATTFLSETAISDDQDTLIAFAEAERGQILFIEDDRENPIIVAYVTKDEVHDGTFSLTVDSIADGLIMSSPLMMGYTPGDRLAILSKAKDDVLYTDLKNEISSALNKEPENLLNEAVYPKVYEYSIVLILNAINTITMERTRVLRFKDAPAVAIGNEDIPYLGDIEGDNIVFVNPTMIFYGIDIEGFNSQLIAGKEQAWGLLWWKHGPITEEFGLGEGIFNISFRKGGLSGKAAKMAATANSLKAIQLFMDTFFWCPVDNKTIEYIVEGNILAGFGDIFIDYAQKTPQKFIEGVVDLLLNKENWVKITKAFYRSADDKNAAVKFLKNSKKILKAADAVFKVLEAYDAATKTVPFFWDLIFKPAEFNLCIRQTNGIIEATEEKIPPTASIIKISPDIPYVGDIIIFDASSSYDDIDNIENLQVKWSFYGDANFDSDWVNQKTSTNTYSNVGSYDIWLQVKDGDGLIGSTIYTINIKAKQAQGTAKHIKVFRDVYPWESFAFETLMADFGYDEGLGENQYEILPSDRMSSEIMIPGQDLIVIMNDQDQMFYDNLSISYYRFEQFLENAGVILWEACDLGWADGSMEDAGLILPSGVTYGKNYDYTNYNICSDSELMSGIPDILDGDWASHEHFSNLPASAIIYTTDTQGLPTLIEYSYSNGWVMLTGQPLEWGYDNLDEYNIGQIYPKLFNYILGRDQQNPTFLKGSKRPKLNKLHSISSHRD